MGVGVGVGVGVVDRALNDMENENRKCEKINDDQEGEEEPLPEDKDEEKMDKFFALIRSFRDARDRRRNELKQLEITNNINNIIKKTTTTNTKKRKADQDHRDHKQSSWVPSFEWEDFSDQIEGIGIGFRRPPLIFPRSSNKSHHQHREGKCMKEEEEDQQSEECSLDLKLAL